MDFWIGLIIGVVGHACYVAFNDYRNNLKKPKRGRPTTKDQQDKLAQEKGFKDHQDYLKNV